MYGRLGIHLGEEDGVAGRQRRHRILPFASGRQVKRSRCSGWRIKHVGGHWGVVGSVVAAGALIRSNEQRRAFHRSRFRVHEILCLGHHAGYRGSRGGEYPHMGKYRARQPAGESRCRIRMGLRLQILAQGGCDAAAAAEPFVESAGDPFPTAEVVKGKFVVEKVPVPGEVEIAEAWQPMQLTLVGPLTGYTTAAHPFAEGVGVGAGVPPVSLPTTAQSHPSHQRFESLTIPLQKRMGEVKSVSAYSSLITIAPSGTGPCRF
jgi:hypothetical protein